MQRMHQLRYIEGITKRGHMQAIKDEYVTTSEAASILGINRVTLHRWVKQGALRAYSLGPRKVLFKRADLIQLLKPVKGEEVEFTVKERLGRIIPPLTDEQVQQGLAAMRAGRDLGERIARRLGTKPWKPSWEIINEARDERTKQLL